MAPKLSYQQSLYHRRFEKIMKQLNDSQRAAVEQIEGPVMTIAGPGTGKTHILAARIGQILLQTDSRPYNILCLTFTDAGVQAMRQRLLEFIGPEAYRIHIYTFHSFCNKVILENPDNFGQKNWQLATELEQIDFARQLLDGLEPDHPLRRSRRQPYRYEGQLLRLFQLMKTEGWTLELVQEKIEDYLDYIKEDKKYRYQRNGSNYKKGDLKLKAYQEEKERMQRLLSAAALFEEYEFLMEEASCYDYADMILWVLRAFLDPEQEELLLRYQEQYLYILVDEFQDTNGAQNQILMQLIGFWEQPNIFIVGDDDQSIFEFQGARVKNLIDFFERYQNGLSLVMLQDNYRSSQEILDASKALIDHNELRIISLLEALELDKKLRARRPFKQGEEIELELQQYPTAFEEEVAIVEKIKQLKAEKQNLAEVAIIYARHRQSQDLIRLLEQAEIPYQTKRQINILEESLIKNFLLLLEYLALEFEQPYSGEEYLYELLHFQFIPILASDRRKLVNYMVRENRRRYLAKEREPLAWRDLLQMAPDLTELRLIAPEKIRALVEFFDEATGWSVNEPLSRLMELLFNRSGLLQYASEAAEKDWYLGLLNTFFDFVRRESERKEDLNLWGLLELIQRMKDNQLRLPMTHSRYAEDGVQLLTAHASKGLEFQYVFMLHCLDGTWGPNSRRSIKKFKLPDNLSQAHAVLDQEEASRRLFYVAMTRSRAYLRISYHANDSQGKSCKRLSFVDDLMIDAELEEQQIQLPASTLQQYRHQFLQYLPERLPQELLVDPATIAAQLEDFRLSVTALNAYLNCPLSFYFQRVLRLPASQSVEALYGQAVHEALEELLRQGQNNARLRLPSLPAFVSLFEERLEMKRLLFSQRAYEEALDLGLKYLKRYYEQRQERFGQELDKKILLEQSFYGTQYKGVPLTGNIDKLVQVEKGSSLWHIVDYKTGKLEEKRFSAPSKRNPLGGNYYRQLVFYALLLESSRQIEGRAISAEIDYISPNEAGHFPEKEMDIHAEDLANMGELVQEVYAKIKRHEFAEGCQKKDCKWCNFVQHQQIPSSFRDEEVEALDD